MNTIPPEAGVPGRQNGILRSVVPASSVLWTPAQGPSGLIVVARPRSLAAVVGGRIVEVPPTDSFGSVARSGDDAGGRSYRVLAGGLVIVSNSRQKEPTRIIGHPDLASGASVQRGDVLYVSVAEAVYRESRGEDVEVHLEPTADDNEALADLRARARHRWENDRLPDGWTRPLPPVSEKKEASLEPLAEELRTLAERIQAKERE